MVYNALIATIVVWKKNFVHASQVNVSGHACMRACVSNDLYYCQTVYYNKLKVMVYSLLMNYSYETVFAIGLKVYCWHKFQ